MLGPLAAFGLLALAPGAFDVVFLVSFCVAVVGVALFALFVEARSAPVAVAASEAVPAAPTGRVSAIDALRLLRLPRFRGLVLVGSALSAGAISDGLVYVVLQRRVRFEAGVPAPLDVAQRLLVFMVLAMPIGRLADRVGRGPVLVAGYAILAALYALLLLGGRGWATVGASVVLLGACYASTDGVLMALASPLLPAELRTSGLALLTTFTTVARLLASVAFGAIGPCGSRPRRPLVFLVAVVVVVALSALRWAARVGDPSMQREPPLDPRTDTAQRGRSPRRALAFATVVVMMSALAGGAVVRAMNRRAEGERAASAGATAPGARRLPATSHTSPICSSAAWS